MSTLEIFKSSLNFLPFSWKNFLTSSSLGLGIFVEILVFFWKVKFWSFSESLFVLISEGSKESKRLLGSLWELSSIEVGP